MMKEWEAEFFTLSYLTGEMVKVISPHRFQGINFGQAQKSLVRSGMSHWLRLTGTWFKSGEIHKGDTEESVVLDEDGGVFDPVALTEGLSLDEFLDWLDMTDDIVAIKDSLGYFEKAGKKEHVKVIIGHLKHKYNYGSEDKEGLQ